MEQDTKQKVTTEQVVKQNDTLEQDTKQKVAMEHDTTSNDGSSDDFAIIKNVHTAATGATGAVKQEWGAVGEDLVANLHLRQIGDKLQLKENQIDIGDNASSLFDKAANGLFRSTMIYAFADIRTLIRENEGEIEGDPVLVKDFMELPITNVNALKVINANFHLLKKHFKESEIEIYRSAIRIYGGELLKQAVLEMNQKPTKRASIYQEVQTSDPVELHVFDDAHSDKELVYAIAVDRGEKREITITFRGSVTVHDWLIDTSFSMVKIPNPLKEQAASSFSIPQDNKVGMHSGFHKYLFGCNQAGVAKSKYDQILDHVLSLLETFQGFSIMVTGHSLGAALATLCSFRLALEDDRIKKPITCISIASPRTGNIAFVRAFQELELQQKIVCLRVANRTDLITRHPDRLNVLTFAFQNEIYRHVGIDLLLYPESKKNPEKTHKLKRVRVHRSRLGQLSDDFAHSFRHSFRNVVGLTCGCCIDDYMKLHSCEEYMIRLQRAASNLQEMSMIEIYAHYRSVVSELRASTASRANQKETSDKKGRHG